MKAFLVMELGGQFPEYSLARGRPGEILAGLVDRNFRGSGEDQDMEQIGDVDILLRRM